MTSQAPGSMKRPGGIYEQLGVKPVINGGGTWTVLGGCIMEPETVAAMAEASRAMVRLSELHQRAGEIIAKHTGAEAGHVSAGAACGMMLEAAAVIAGKDPVSIARLPDSAGMRNEIVVKWTHNLGYVQAWRQAGAKLVWAGDRYGARAWELEAVITDRTAAIGYVASRWIPDTSFSDLDEVVRVARAHGLPVIVDAAGMLPPAENLRRFIEHGADMVSFSGGKALLGPQSTGILCGRKHLIEAAALNNNPNYSVGRVAKVCREEIIGLIVALERYVKRDHAADQRRWRRDSQVVVDAIHDIPGVVARVEQEDWSRPFPEAVIWLGKDWRGPAKETVLKRLADADPPVIIGGGRLGGEDMFVNPHGFQEGDAAVVAKRLRAALTEPEAKGRISAAPSGRASHVVRH